MTIHGDDDFIRMPDAVAIFAHTRRNDPPSCGMSIPTLSASGASVMVGIGQCEQVVRELSVHYYLVIAHFNRRWSRYGFSGINLLAASRNSFDACSQTSALARIAPRLLARTGPPLTSRR